MNKPLMFLLDILFPNRCPVCGRFEPFDRLVCEKCEKELSELSVGSEVCKKCGKPDCICKGGISFERAVTVFYYEQAAKNGILALKDGGAAFGTYLGMKLAEKIKSDSVISSADLIVPVPMSKEGLYRRGYNQAEIIAKEASRLTGIPFLKGALFRKNSEAQHMLSARERKKNVSAFCGGDIDLKGKRIIVCDDVITTGSTINRCASLLKEMNASEIYAAVGTTTKLKKE